MLPVNKESQHKSPRQARMIRDCELLIVSKNTKQHAKGTEAEGTENASVCRSVPIRQSE